MQQEENKENAGISNSIDIKDLLSMGLAKWYWFIISLAITLGLATLYILRTAPVYTHTASLLLKESNNSSDPLNKTAASQFSMFENNTYIQNQMLTLKSVSLMKEVVNRLHLNDSYTSSKGLRIEDMYKANPVIITLLDSAFIEQSVSLRFDVEKNGKIHMWDFKVGKDDLDGEVTGRIGQALKTPLGNIMVTRAPWYNDLMLERTYTFNHCSELNAAKSLAGGVNTSLADDDADIVTISFTSTSQLKNDELLNTLIQVYNERWIDDKNEVAHSTSLFINDRLAVIERELGEVDSDISSYKSQNLLTDLDASSRLYMTESVENQGQLLNLNNQLYMAKFLHKDVASGNITKPLPANSGLEIPAVEAQIREYNTMVLERNRLLAASSENNPLVRDLTASLEASRTSLAGALENAITSLNTQIRSLQGREAKANSQLAQTPGQAKYLLSVERQQKVKESLYLFLLEKREENELSQAFSAYNTRIIDAPLINDAATSPKKSQIFMIAFILGLLLPFGIIFLRESINTKVRGKKDLEGLNIPIMGEIPQIVDENHHKSIKKGKRRINAGVKDIVVAEGKRDVVNEAFRVLRTNLDFMAGSDQGCRTVMVTSFNPGSGKSLITMNMAVALSLRNKRVLVIDGDLRRASASAFVNTPRKGISNYLAGSVSDIHSVITQLPGKHTVDVIPVGKIPPNPSELLGEKRMGELVKSLEPEYDYILIDCPPVDIVADTAVLASLANRTIFVVRAGLLERAMLPELENLYNEHRFNNMSIILNCVPVSSGRYGYKYGYKYGHYGYGYGYGYGYSSYTASELDEDDEDDK